MSQVYDDGFCCENCGYDEANIVHTYTIARTFEDLLRCICKKSKNGIAETFRYNMPEIWEEVGYLKAGRFKLNDRILVDRLPMEIPIKGSDERIYCRKCRGNASANDHETEQIGNDEIVEGPDAWRMLCARCKAEIEFGWTEPNRRGLIVPLPTSGFDISRLSVDPGFRIRQIRSQR